MSIQITRYMDSDIKEVISLFYETVHAINARDYSSAQLDAWASKDDQLHKEQLWTESLRNNISYVAHINGTMVGFVDMSHSGYLDRLYVHKDFQRQGVASSLVNMVEFEANKLALTRLSTDASITAKPFFLNRGYQIMQTQNVERNGVTLVNFKMMKQLT